MTWFLRGRSPIFLFVSVGLAAWVLHCGGSDGSAIITGSDDGSATDGAGGNTNGEGGVRGTGDGAAATIDGSPQNKADGAPAGDAGPVVIPDGGAPLSEGGVTCAGSACDTNANTCCGFADGGEACLVGTGGAVCNSPTASRRTCDETADCPSGLVCCYELGDNGSIGTGCHADCNGNGGRRVQACRQEADCKQATCAVRTCDNGDTIESCGPLSNACN